MKKVLLLLTSLFIAVGIANAQDVITKKNGEKVLTRVIEVGDQSIKYKRFDNQDGPLYTISKAEVSSIVYENGYTDNFSTFIQDKLMYKDAQPGMTYSEIKKVYNPKEYIKKVGDPYNPGLAGVCSFLIPGLGQMLNGEAGRGLGNLLGSAALTGAGYGIFSAAAETPEGASQGESIAAFACFLGALFIDISSITGAVKMAKVKNMYNQDMNTLQAKSDIRFYPAVSGITMAGTYHFYPGIRMTVSF